MKTYLNTLLVCLLVTGTVVCQSSGSLMKEARRAYANLAVASTSIEKIERAKEAIDDAFRDPKTASSFEAWLLKGRIYKAAIVHPEHHTSAGPVAAEAYESAFGLIKNDIQRMTVSNEMYSLQSSLTNAGLGAYDKRDYNAAFNNFNMVFTVHEFLKAKGEKSTLSDAESYNYQAYITGLTALNAQKNTEAIKLFKHLYDVEYDKPAVYEALHNLEGDVKYLEEGMKRYPDEASLSYALINHKLRNNEMEDLVPLLRKVMADEPSNVSLKVTMGSVHDNLFQRAMDRRDPEAANYHFSEATLYYGMARDTDPNNFGAAYSLGALYFNKAAYANQKLIELDSDMSEEGLKKYDAQKQLVKQLMNSALPYFQQAESIDPNDVSTLIALMEIYGRLDNLEMMAIFKDRRAAVESGKRYNTSYFSN